MPRYYDIVCEYCGQSVKRPASINGPPRFCSRDCLSANWLQKTEERIGEPLCAALYRLYVLEERSYRYICSCLGLNNRTVAKYLRKYGIEPRHGSDAIRTQWIANPERRKQQGKRFQSMMSGQPSWSAGLTKHDHAGLMKISQSKQGNKNPMFGRCGSLHHLWQGGKLWWRGKDWNDIKEQARKRDNYRCQHCAISDIECIQLFGAPLQVHHIVPYRLSYDHSLSNLKTLCNHCHGIADNDFLWVL